MTRDWWWPWWWSSAFDAAVVIAAVVVALRTSRRFVRAVALSLAAVASIGAVLAPFVMKQPMTRTTVAGSGPLPKTAPEGSCLRPGSYTTTVFRPCLSFLVGDDWCYEQIVDWFAPLWWQEKPQFLILERPAKVYDPQSGRAVAAPDDLVAWLTRHPRFRFKGPASTQIGGLDATVLDGKVKDEPACLWPGIYPGKDQCVGASDEERLRVLVLDVGKSRLVISIHGLIDRWREFRPEADALLRTIRFER